MFQIVDPGTSTTLQSYEHRQLLHRARRYIYIKGAVNVVIAFLFLLTFPLELEPKMVAIALTDALFLVPYWFLVQRYPTLATGLSLGITSLAISAGDWVGGYQTGASGILYALLVLGGHLVLINPFRTYLIAGLITAIYVGTIALEVTGMVPINFPFTLSNLSRVVSLNVISMIGLTILTGVVTRLYRELLQRNKELFALNAVSAAASQSLNLDEVLQLALDKVLGVMELEGGGLYLLEANTGEMVLKVHRNLEEFVGWVSRMDIGIEGFADSPLRTGRVLVVDDPSQHPIMGKTVGDEEWRYPLIIVPLKVENRVLGTMNLLGQAGCSFTSQDIALLNIIGAQIGMAIENARLYEVEQDRYRMAESLRKMAEVIGSTLELNEVLQLTLEQLRKVLDYDTSSIMMLEGDRFQVIAVEGFADPEEVLQLSYTADEVDISWEAIRAKQALVIADVTQDARWTYEPQTADVRAWIGAPLIAKDGVIGLLTVDSYQVGKYSQEDAELVMTFAKQAALAIKNAQLFREMKERFEETIALYQTSLEIPERKRAEEMLRIKGHTIASSINAIAIAEFAGSLTYVNNSFLQMWGYDDESEVLGKPAVEFWQMEEKAWDVVEALRDGGSWIGELAAKRKDGSLFDVQLSASAVADEAGRPICMMASFVDITERKRRTAELSTMLEATRAVSSTLDLEEVLALIAEQMVRAVGVDGCTISRWDQEVDAVITWIEWRHQDLEWADEPGTAYSLDDFPATRAVLETRQPVTVRVSDPNADPAEVAYLRKAQIASLLMLPLAVGNQVIGLVELDDEHERDFTAAEIRLCQALGDQATVAIENAQLYAETQRRLQEQTALREASAAISSSLDLQTVLSRIAEQMGRTLDATSAYICSFEPETMMSTVLAEYIGPQACPQERVSDLGVTYVEGDVEVDVEFLETMQAGEHDIAHIDDPNASEFERAHMQQYGGQTILYIPLLVKGQFLGFTELWESRRRREFTPEEIALCQDMAQQAAIALENARLFEGERRQRQTAETLLKTSSAVASTLDLSQVLLTLAARLMDISGFHLCAISEWDREAKQTRTLVERTRAVWPPKGGEPYRLSDHPTTERVLRTGGPEVVHVGMDDPELIWMDEIGLTALLMLPLRGGEETIGLAEVGSPVAEAAFDQKGVLRCQQVLQEAASWLQSPLEANSGDALLALAGRLAEMGGGSWCALSAWHQAEGEVRTVAEHSEAIWPPGVGSAYWLGDYPSSVRALEEGTSTVARLSDPAIDCEDREELGKWGARTLVIQPLSVKGEPIGLIELYDMAEERDVSEDELRLWRAVADQAAVAVQNARLYEQARREIAERKRVEEALQEAHEELERRVEERTAELSKANVLLEREITVRRQTEEALERRAAQLAVVNEVAQRAASILDMDQLLREVVAAIQQGFDYHNVALSLLDEATGELEVQAIAGAFTDLVSPDYRQVVGMGMVGWVAETGQSLLANDVSQEPRYILGFLGEPLTKAELCVPLKLAGRAIGVLDVQDTQLNAFDDTDLLAMETLADQIAVAIENARLFEEAKRRFEETTALYQTSLDITAQLEMTELLKSIVERAVTLLRAEGGGIYLYNPEREDLRWAVTYGHAEKYVGTTLKPGEGLAGKVFQTGEPLIVDDYRTWEGRAPAYEADEPFTALLQVPLRWHDRVIGVLSISADMEKRTFNGDDIWLATLFANQVAVAIENARIYEEERKRVTQLELISGVIQKITSILNLDELLSQVTHLIRDTFGYYNIGIHLVEADSKELILRAADGPLGEALIDRLRLKIGQEGITGWVAHSGEPLLVNDVSREPRYYFVEESQDTRSQLAVPIKLKGEVIGVLDALSVELDAFSQDDVSILQTLADELAVAIENARLYEAKRLQLLRLEELAAASQEITADLDLASVLKEIGTQALTTLEADRAAIFLLDWETDRLTCAYSSGLSPEYVTRVDHSHRDSLGGPILSFSEPIHVLDAQTDPASEAMREAIGGEGYHTFAVLPLVSKGKAVGALAIYRDTIRAFTPEALALAQSFANQAAVAIENARLYQEVQQRVEELTFLNRGGRAVTSSLDLKQILATVTEETALVLKAEACSILLLDEESSGLVFEAAYGPQSEKVKGLRLPLDQGIAGWVARKGQRCLVPDVREDPRFYVGIDEITDFVTKSVLVVPLKVRGKVIGLIEAVNKTKGDFSQADIALLSSIAQWAAIAIENARLYQQTDEKLQTRVRELAALYSVAEMVNRSDLDTVLQLALDSAIGVTGMESGGIMLLDPSTDELFLKAHRAGSPQFIRVVDYARADEGLMPRMLKTAVVIDDLSEVTKERRVAIQQEGIQSLVSVPLKAQESPLGVMVIAGYSPRAFASEELELLAAIANQVGVAVDRANLQAQELRAAILEERQHMARQMHDDIAQTLGYLGLQVDSVMGSASLVQNAEVQTELEGIRGAIEDTYERVRGSIIRLREDIPDQLDFVTALQASISEFEKQSKCKVESKIAGEQPPFLSPPVAFQAIYIIGEALTNVRKHSGADFVHLTLRGLEEGRVEVTIQDNGQGFDLDSEQQSSGRGFGLRFMRERAERVGGSLRVESEPGQGTRVIVSLPSG